MKNLHFIITILAELISIFYVVIRYEEYYFAFMAGQFVMIMICAYAIQKDREDSHKSEKENKE